MVTIVVPFSGSRRVQTATLEMLSKLDRSIEILFVPVSNTLPEYLEKWTEENTRGFILSDPVEEDHFNYPKAYNLALNKSTTKYVVYINPGLINVTENWLDELVILMETDEKIAALSPKLLTETGIIDHTGILYKRGESVRADQHVPIGWGKTDKRMLFQALTDNCLITRNIQRFDEQFRDAYYMEDWCLRATKEHEMVSVYDPSVTMRMLMPCNESLNSRLNYIMFYAKHHENQKGLDNLSDTGTYYESGPNFPANEAWQHKELSHGKIVCFLADHDGCGTYRIKLPYRQLVLNGWEVLFTVECEKPFIDDADIVVFQRAVADHMIGLMDYAHENGKYVIYEIDDFFHGLSPDNPVTFGFAQNPEWLRNMERMIYKADALTVSTPELAKQYGKFNTNTYIVPNCIDFGLIARDTIIENTDGTVRIGWAGSATHDSDIILAHDAMARIMQDYDNVVLVFVGTDYRNFFPNVDRDRMEWYPSTWGHEDPVGDYYRILNMAHLDIGLAPITDSLFNKNKSSIKAIEYGAFGIVPITSDVEPYALFMKESKERLGYVCRTERDWYKNIARLIEDNELRIEIAKNVQTHVWNNYGLQKMADILEQVIAKLLTDGGHKNVKPEPAHSLSVTYLNHRTSKQLEEMAIQQRAAFKEKEKERKELALKG